MGSIRAVQTIADDQTEVATKTQTLIDAEGIDSTEIKTTTISSFGANKFLITLIYASIVEAKEFIAKTGFNATIKRILVLHKTLTTIIGVKTTFVDLWKLYRKLSTEFGLVAVVKAGSGRELTTEVGLKALTPVGILPRTYRTGSTKAGIKAVIAAQLNGVPIII